MSDEQISFFEEEQAPSQIEFIASRHAGLKRLDDFAPFMARAYASKRNFDLGATDRSNISALSPWIRHRLISEEEVLRETLKQHSLRSAEKFIQEVFWRSYFKGWLEQRRDVWTWYKQDLLSAINKLEKDASLNQRYQEATLGKTGLAAFDHWAKELVETGYLHNHARMWFASIWIFTLKLPWELGADFFYRHLMDGDPASNTCSWRWVGGLHTKGKNYAASASNIERFTNGRFANNTGLAKDPVPLDDPREARLILPPVSEIHNDQHFTLLITQEDCFPETLPIKNHPSHIIGLVASDGRSPFKTGIKAKTFAHDSVMNTIERSEDYFECSTCFFEQDDWAKKLLEHSKENNIKTIITAFAPVGSVADQLKETKRLLAEHDIHLKQVLRNYDALSWPHATKGFFKLKKQIPHLLNELNIA